MILLIRSWISENIRNQDGIHLLETIDMTENLTHDISVFKDNSYRTQASSLGN